MASFSRTRDELQDDLQEQLESLRREIQSVRKGIAKRGYGAYRDSRHFGEELVDMLRDYLEDAIPSMRRGAHALEKTARRNPGTTAATVLVGAAVIGLAVAFFARR